ncbi:MAG: hypothetical protein WBE76_15225 [Terracidiphilus sp.]
MSAAAKWIFASIIFGGFFIWFLTPLRSPSNAQMVGQYNVALGWGEASLRLDADHTFREVLHTRVGETHEVMGKWSLNSNWQPSLLLAPFWQFTQDDPGTRIANAALPVES